MQRGYNMLNKSIRQPKKAYKKRCEIQKLDIFLKNLRNVYLGNTTYLGEKEEMILDPPYQRGLCWSLEQKKSYITNIFNEMAKCTPTIVEYYSDDYTIKYFEVLDGKQRLTTLFDFIDNKFPILYDGEEVYFNDLIDEDKTFLLYLNVNYTRVMPIKLNTNVSLKDRLEIFLEVNYLGTKMSDEHLKNVLAMYNKEK